ncbi:MAG: type II toxin-antitoxin system RelB/DinJ family antitoxin [Clostridia bacterium]|nr:type II toxin-antitoxin system RelB/DinJ family antitoxin [Clostridia bacterium]
MATTSVTIRMDENLKRQAESLFNEMGMNMTTAITLFTKAAVREGRIPFEIKVDPFYSERNTARLIRAARDMDEGRNCAPHEAAEE